MATIKFQILSPSENAPIYLGLSIKRGLTPRTKTGLNINPKEWSVEKHLPKQNNPENKNLTTDLLELKTYILKKVNGISKENEVISTQWLKHNIDVFFKRVTENKQSDLLTDAIQSIITDAPFRKNGKKDTGLSVSRINSFKALLKSITEYQKLKNIKVKDVNIKFGKEYLKYLLNIKNYQKSTALKRLADLKTVCKDAEIYGIETNPQFKSIESAKSSNENIIYLTPQELTAIEGADLIKEAHKNARKWLLLGCNIGQRGGDLLRLTESNFVTRNGLQVIELKQQKTDKNVTIPVLETTKEILKNGLPYKISIQKFNEYLKIVCQEAKLTDKIKGKLLDPETMRKKDGLYHKWQLMASHVCRRSFATNLYGTLPTPLIMQVTGHSSEKMLLNYIGKNSLDYAQQIADFYTLQALKQNKKPQLSIVKKAK